MVTVSHVHHHTHGKFSKLLFEHYLLSFLGELLQTSLAPFRSIRYLMLIICLPEFESLITVVCHKHRNDVSPRFSPPRI